MGSLCHPAAFLLKMANNLFLPSAIILACLVFAVSAQSSDAGEGSGQGAGASVNVNACREREAYSPENIKAFPICCLRPNFMENSIAQGGVEISGKHEVSAAYFGKANPGLSMPSKPLAAHWQHSRQARAVARDQQ